MMVTMKTSKAMKKMTNDGDEVDDGGECDHALNDSRVQPPPEALEVNDGGECDDTYNDSGVQPPPEALKLGITVDDEISATTAASALVEENKESEPSSVTALRIMAIVLAPTRDKAKKSLDEYNAPLLWWALQDSSKAL
jgi:hypothetical protein